MERDDWTERAHSDDEYLFHDFSIGRGNEPLPGIIQSIFSQASSPDSDYDFKDYDTEPYVGNSDLEDDVFYENDFDSDEDFYSQADDEDDYLDDDVRYYAYNDSGEYRTYDGNHKYRSFDASLPETSPEDWYHYAVVDMELDDYGDEYGDHTQQPKKKAHRKLKIFANSVLGVLTFFSVFYLIAIYSNVGFISNLRELYIKTAMDTLSHKWLATSIIPSDIIDDVMIRRYKAEEIGIGVTTDWGTIEVNTLPSFSPGIPQAPVSEINASEPSPEPTPEETRTEEEIFYEVFWELDKESMQGYLIDHPEALENGWSQIDINESGLEDDGTNIKTIHDDQVLALNAKDGVLIIRTEFNHPIAVSRGTIAICKDITRLDLCPADTLGTIGQTVAKICDASDGLLAINGSAFMDLNGNGNGGDLSGLMVSKGQTYGAALGGFYKRLELRDDNKMYVVDSSTPVGDGTRNACEFMPAVIVDGEINRGSEWDGVHPRAILGQTSRLEAIMAIGEGRLSDSGGCGVEDVAEVLVKYGCVQAMNLDGGTSAIMYYKGETITRCSNQNLPDGRTLPSAWVYHAAE